MTWTSIRLDLARTPDFPEGSAAHAFLVHLPLDAEGHVEADALAAEPGKAIVHRSWPGEPDMQGYVIAAGGGWAFSYCPGEEDDERLFHLETHPIKAGQYLSLTEPDGRTLPLRVANLSVLD